MKTDEMIDIFREWIEKEQIDEAVDPNYDQQLYRVIVVLTIFKGVGGDRTETQNEMRSIPNVTTVTLENELGDLPGSFRGEYSIKFALERGEGVKDYIRRILRPEMKRIQGLRVDMFKKIEKVEKAQGWQGSGR